MDEQKIAAAAAEAAVAALAPMIQAQAQPQHYQAPPTDEKKGEWIVLKAVGGVALSIFGVLFATGLMWAIRSIGDNADNIAAVKSDVETNTLLDENRDKVINEKLDGIALDIKSLSGSTADRFKPIDFRNGTAPMLNDISRNAAEIQTVKNNMSTQIQDIKNILAERNSFMSDTKSDLESIKRDLYKPGD